jgi:exosortase/archaeosortase family protein
VYLALAAIPIAVFANGARILGTGLAVQYWDPQKALGFFHEFSGWLIFVVSLICLYLLHTAMNLSRRKRGRQA